MSDHNAVVIVDKMILQLRMADITVNYTPEFLRQCMAYVVQASAGIALPNVKIATAQGLAEAAYIAGLRDYPLDLLAEEFKKHLLCANQSRKGQLLMHQLAGIMTIRLSTALSIFED